MKSFEDALRWMLQKEREYLENQSECRNMVFNLRDEMIEYLVGDRVWMLRDMINGKIKRIQWHDFDCIRDNTTQDLVKVGYENNKLWSRR